MAELTAVARHDDRRDRRRGRAAAGAARHAGRVARRRPGHALREDPRAAGRRRRGRAAPAPVRRLPARAEQRRDQPAARRRRRRGACAARSAGASSSAPPSPGLREPVRRRGRRRVARATPGRRPTAPSSGRRDRCGAARARRAHRHREQQRRGVPRPDRRAEAVRELDPAATVEARLDSKLVVEQMSGRWKIKHPDMRRAGAAGARGAAAGAGDLHLGAAGAEQARRPAGQRGARRRGPGRGVVGGRQHGRAAQPGATGRDEADAEPGRRERRWSAGTSGSGTPTTTRAAAARRDRAHGGEAVQRVRRAGPRAVRRRASVRPAGGRRPARGRRRRRRRRQPRRCGGPGRPPTRSPRRWALDVREVDGLRECAFGEWEGLTFDEVREGGRTSSAAWLGRPDGRAAGRRVVRRRTPRGCSGARDQLLARYPRQTVLVVTPRDADQAAGARRAGRTAVGAVPDGAVAGDADRGAVVRRRPGVAAPLQRRRPPALVSRATRPAPRRCARRAPGGGRSSVAAVRRSAAPGRAARRRRVSTKVAAGDEVRVARSPRPRPSTGATQASLPANTSVHSSRVRVAKASAMRRRSAGQVDGSVRSRSPRVDAQPAHQLVVERRLQGADGHPAAVGRPVGAVERRAAVEQVGCPAGPARRRPRAGRGTSWSGARCCRPSPRRRPGPAPDPGDSCSAASSPTTQVGARRRSRRAG